VNEILKFLVEQLPAKVVIVLFLILIVIILIVIIVMLIRVNRKVDWIDINAQAQEYATVKTFANGKTPQYNEFRKEAMDKMQNRDEFLRNKHF